MKRIDAPEPLKVIKANKQAGINSFIMQLYFNDQYPCLQKGLFYFKWRSIEDFIVEWLCLEYDIVVLFSAKDNIKFPDAEMERKFKDLMGTQVQFNPNDKYSRLSMQNVKLFELPKDAVESCYAISRALSQQKLKVAVVIQRAEILLPESGLDFRLLDNIKSWVMNISDHMLILLTDNKNNIHHEIKHISPPMLKSLEWKPPVRENFEELFMDLKILKPQLFDGSDIKRLSSVCEGIHYLELEKLINKLDNEKKSLTEELLKEISSNSRKETGMCRTESCFMVEKPNVRFDDIVGLENVIEIIKVKLLYPLKFPELLRKRKIKIGGGILFIGPPGTGKTLLGKAIATELDIPLLPVKVADIKSKYVGDPENNIKRLFMEARRYQRSIIHIEEIEALLPSRGSQESTYMAGMVAQFLAEMDGLSTNKQNPVLVIGSTNRPQDMDSAALRPGRFDYKILVSLPDKEARKKMFYLNLRGSFISNIDYSMLAGVTEGYSGADIAGICRKTEELLVLKDIKKGCNHPINMEIMHEVIKGTKPSVSKEEMEWFRQFERMGNEGIKC